MDRRTARLSCKKTEIRVRLIIKPSLGFLSVICFWVRWFACHWVYSTPVSALLCVVSTLLPLGAFFKRNVWLFHDNTSYTPIVARCKRKATTGTIAFTLANKSSLKAPSFIEKNKAIQNANRSNPFNITPDYLIAFVIMQFCHCGPFCSEVPSLSMCGVTS